MTASVSMARRLDDVESPHRTCNPLQADDIFEQTAQFSQIDNGMRFNSGGDSSNGVTDECADTTVTQPCAGDDDSDLPQCKIKRNYSCNLCPFFSQNPRSFLYHSRDVHFDRIKIYECSQCLYASKHSQKLQRHINMIHVAGKSKIKRTGKIMKAERRNELRTIKPKPTEVVAATAKCLKSKNWMNTLSAVKTEEENVTEVEREESLGQEFNCSACDFKNNNLKLMRRHEKVVHLKKRFLRCNKCSYVTHVKARYTKHVKYHSMPMIKCDLCDFRTPYKWNLDRHYKNHCGTGAFQCTKCNFRADIKQSLTVHEMNHHVPPVGQGAIMARKKNKVGASDVPVPDFCENQQEQRVEMSEVEIAESCGSTGETKEAEKCDDQKKTEAASNSDLENIRNIKEPHVSKRESAHIYHLQTDFIHPDDIVPRYGQIYVKNLKCKFCSYKAVFSHEIWRHEKRIHGYIRPEIKKKRAPKRPPPRLIPIKNKPAASNQAILKIPAVKNQLAAASSTGDASLDKPVNDSEFSEMCKKSCLTSSLKDFVSLIGDEEGLKTIPDSSRDYLDAENPTKEDCEECSETKASATLTASHTDFLKKKNASFFDKLKEKLLVGNNEERTLFCEVCGHISKCLSESVAHQKRHSNMVFKNECNEHSEHDFAYSGAQLSSTRCQYCRQRCKTSADLYNHLKSCRAFGVACESQVDNNRSPTNSNFLKSEDLSGEDVEEKLEGRGGRGGGEEEEEEEEVEEEKSTEKRVFVWNDLDQGFDEDEVREAMALERAGTYGECGTEEASEIYGTVTNEDSDNAESGTLVVKIDPRLSLTVKKVFKCPHCSFWASTASRFHVHIVGHLNKKPFECSLCLYRSNWRWDITKHIRLKSARDPTHLQAQVNMTDETGRRNYSKYNKYLTMMKVQEPSAESSGTGRRSKPAEATQGNVAEQDIIPLPAPPRLTRAPMPGIPQQVLHGVPLRPPPLLKAAHQVQAKTLASVAAKENAKKTFWKCKKCNFRDSSKDSVLIHVKTHYGKKNEGGTTIGCERGELSSSFTRSTSPSSHGNFSTKEDDDGKITSRFRSNPFPKIPSYKCGHCQQASNWKHVIQRHCRLKHNGNMSIKVGWSREKVMPLKSNLRCPGNVEPVSEASADAISCDICPFTAKTEGDLTAHKLNHVDRPGSIFKCSYCPFYVPSKIAVLEHMEIHGTIEGKDHASLSIDNFESGECDQNIITCEGGNRAECRKRYKCRQCPYVSNSRTQFLYHKQFHRPREAPFKCLYCSYNVSRRHLLHQHLRVHHQQKEKFIPEEPPASIPISSENFFPTGGPEIPLVWVFKSGNFQKMFKCRWCPHVNARKINIQDHEKMHYEGERKVPTEARNSHSKLCCSECNFSCSNAGILAGHAKVHAGQHVEIESRPDTEQIRELQKRVVESEIVIKEETYLYNIEKQREKKDERPAADDQLLSFPPENAFHQSSDREEKNLNFCNKCPARFFFEKELRIHSKFHAILLPFRCSFCTYTARQKPHLLAHHKVHTEEYQVRTGNLLAVYSVNPDFPRPQTIVLTNENRQANEGRTWTVTFSESEREKTCGKHACHRCPARFFKSLALRHHLTLHGGAEGHKCKYCDYAVKTYGNLMKHEAMHEEEAAGQTFDFSCRPSAREDEKGAEKADYERTNDFQLGSMMQGSPEFIYPTCLKNGKIKEKRYKCTKCPSAFEKRDQYQIHVSLHGSEQKYKCEKCDYSVKYYANYVQHVRKHQNHEEALKARTSESEFPATSESAEAIAALRFTDKLRLDCGEEKKIYECRCCPYASFRKEALNGHASSHYRISKRKWSFRCLHCDYSAPRSDLLREHRKLHFGSKTRYKAEAYLKCEMMELWCHEETTVGDHVPSNLLVFQDKGQGAENRFFPPVHDSAGSGSNEDEKTAAVDFVTRRIVEKTESENCGVPLCGNGGPAEGGNSSKKPKNKRRRGKNWKCKKCPHAFGKKDQYVRHAALHGSNQRHNCDICDYSVKFYTNYVQHMKMHQTHEPNASIFIRKNHYALDETFEKNDEPEDSKRNSSVKGNLCVAST